MPKCDSCGFAHASKDHCINCGSTDPFRRHRVAKFFTFVAVFLITGAAVFYFYQRYAQIERFVLAAEQAAQAQAQFAPASPVVEQPKGSAPGAD